MAKQPKQKKQKERLVYIPTNATGRTRVSMYGRRRPGWEIRPGDWGGMEPMGPAPGQASWTAVNPASVPRQGNQGLGRIAGGLVGGVAGVGNAIEMGARKGVRASAGAAGRTAKKVATPLPAAARSAFRRRPAPPVVTSPSPPPPSPTAGTPPWAGGPGGARGPGRPGPGGGPPPVGPMPGTPQGPPIGVGGPNQRNQVPIRGELTTGSSNIYGGGPATPLPEETPAPLETRKQGSGYTISPGGVAAVRAYERKPEPSPMERGKPKPGLGSRGKGVIGRGTPPPRSMVPDKPSSGLDADAGDIELPPGYVQHERDMWGT